MAPRYSRGTKRRPGWSVSRARANSRVATSSAVAMSPSQPEPQLLPRLVEQDPSKRLPSDIDAGLSLHPRPQSLRRVIQWELGDEHVRRLLDLGSRMDALKRAGPLLVGVGV